jgi:cytosine permease
MAQVEDYYRSEVPAAERKGFFDILFPLLGYVFIYAVIYAGGILGSGLYLSEALIAGVIAALLLGGLAAIDGIVAADTGLTFGLLVRRSFGSWGAWIPNVIIPGVLIVWFGISISFVSDILVKAYGGSYTLYAVVMGVVFFISAYYGIRTLVYLSYPTVGFCILAGVVLIGWPIVQKGGMASLFLFPPVKPISMGDGITIAVGSFVTGATTASLNILRYSRSPIQGGAAGLLSMGVGFLFMLLIGTFGLKAVGSADVMQIGKAVGLYEVGLWMLIVLAWTTLDKTLYSASLTYSASSGTPRSRVVAVMGAIGILLGLVRSINFIVPWLKALGIIVPPLMGIIQADYWRSRWTGRDRGDQLKIPLINGRALAAWAVAVAVAWWADTIKLAISGAVVSICVAVLVHWALSSFSGRSLSHKRLREEKI